MGLSDDQLVDPSSVSDTLRCPICTEVFVEPVFCSGRPCQHVFCRACINQALRQRNQCPTCRGVVRANRLQMHLAIASLLDEIIVRCPSGCGWTGRQDARQAHAAVCPAQQLTAALRQVEERDVKIMKLTDEAAFYNRQLHDSRQVVSKQCQQLAERDARIDELNARLARETAYNESLNNTIGSLQADLLALHEQHCTELEAQGTEAAIREQAAAVKLKKARAQAKTAREALAPGAGMLVDLAGMCSAVASLENRGNASLQPSGGRMQIFVKTISGKTIALYVDGEDYISNVKALIEKRTRVPVSQFYLLFKGKVLADSRFVSDYNISKDSTLFVLGRLRSSCAFLHMDSAILQPARKRLRLIPPPR